MAAEIVGLFVGDDGVVRVARAHDPELVRVVAAAVLHPEAILVRLADIAAVDPGRARGPAQEIGEDLEIREFVVGRKARMGFRRALELGDFRQRFVVHPVLRPSGVDGAPLAVDIQRKHDAIGQIGIVRDRQKFVARSPLRVHPRPQILRMGRVDGGVWKFRDLLRVLEDHVAMHVAVVRRRGPFIGREGGELSRLIVFVGDRDGLFPDIACHLRFDEFLDRLVLEQGGAEEKVDLLDILRTADLQFVGNGQLAQCGVGIVREPHRSNIFRVIGHRLEVERALELHRVATRVLDRLTDRVLVRFFRPGDGVAEYVGVERPACMDMGLAEIDVPLGDALGEAGRRCKDADPKSKRRHRKAAANRSPQCHGATPV